MAIKCTICYAWQPKEWDGAKGHWADTVAQCEIKHKFTTAGESCGDGKIVRPAMNTSTPIQRSPVTTEVKHAPTAIPFSGELYAHQKEAFEQFKDEPMGAEFMEMGCVDADTEFFTGTCWKRIADYEQDDMVLQWNEDGSTSLVEPEAYVKYDAPTMVHFKTARGMDQMLSLEHRLVSYNRQKKRRQDMSVRELLEQSGQNYLCPIAFNGYPYAPELWQLDENQTRLMIAVIAEGHFAGTNRCYINFKKDYKIERLDMLLAECNIEASKRICDDGYTRYSFIAPERWKVFGPEWFNCPTSWVTSEVMLWDGDLARGEYRTTIKQSADFIQFKFASIGLRTSIVTSDRRAEDKGLLYVVIVSDQTPYTTWFSDYTQGDYPKIVPNPEGHKYCFTVPSTYLVLRRNNNIFVTGNTGKSAVILRIAGYKFKKGEINALLIVAPNDVHVQWAHEQVPLWLDCPYEIQCLYGRGGSKVSYPFDDDGDETLKVVCVNIDTFSTPQKWKDFPEFVRAYKTMIVLDEATVIKSVSAQRTQRMLYAFNDVVMRKKTVLSSTPFSKCRFILTGTPVTNGPMDMWAMMEFLQPNFFKRNWYSFQAHFGMFTTISVNDRPIKVPLSEEWWHVIKGITDFHEASAISGCSEDTFNTIHAQEKYEGPYKHAEELRELIRPVSYFKQLRDCVDMPQEVRLVRDLTMTPEIERCYYDMVTELLAEYEGHVATARTKLTSLIRLQQICSGFICDKTFEADASIEEQVDGRIVALYGLMDDEDILPDEIQWIGSSNPKLDMLYRDVDELAKPLIIATRFTAEAARIYNDLAGKYRVSLQTGWKRVGSIDEFKEGKYDVMVANSMVINRGFNLQNSHVILVYANTFSLETRLQLEGRIFRIGQQHPCMYVDYCYPGSVDEKITQTLKMKRNLLDFIREADMKEIIT
jgi:superfamily II DNA or RNA helicase